MATPPSTTILLHLLLLITPPPLLASTTSDNLHPLKPVFEPPLKLRGSSAPQPSPHSPPPPRPSPPSPSPQMPPPPRRPPPPRPTPPPPPSNGTCPADSMKVYMCVDLLWGLIHMGMGPEKAGHECCPVLMGLAGLDAAVCLCMVIRARFMGLQTLIPMALQLLAYCGKSPPPGYVCPFPPE